MVFTDVAEAKRFLITRGGYEDNGKLSSRNYNTYEEYRIRILSIARSVSEKLDVYPVEIHNFLITNPTPYNYSLKELRNMTYVELSRLRKELGINNRKKKTAKKVTSTTSAPAKTIKQAKETLAQETTNVTAKKIYLSGLQHDLEIVKNDDPDILTVSEIMSMYGTDLPTVDYLLEHGIVPSNIHEYEEQRRKL